jgi:hypothetical protein
MLSGWNQKVRKGKRGEDYIEREEKEKEGKKSKGKKR